MNILKRYLIWCVKKIKTNNTKIKYINEVEIITVAKVGSSSIHKSFGNSSYRVKHHHSLKRLREIINSDSNTLVVVGIRNPIDRNLSYFFQTYSDDFLNTLKTKHNNYLGEYCYLCPKEKINDMKIDRLISKYFKMPYHNTFNEWFEEFFEITGINSLSFDKNKGLQFYNFPNNNIIMIYTLEKLNSNRDEICDRLKLRNLTQYNTSKTKHYKGKYQEVKNKINYKPDYLDSLLKTETMNFFYTKSDIKLFYNKYKMKN